MARLTAIMTRPTGSNSAFLDRIADDVRACIDVIESPLIAIVPLAVDIQIDPQHAVIFTSSNAVRLAPDGEGRRAYCVGEGTQQSALTKGWDAQVMGRDADEFVSNMADVVINNPLHHLSGVHVRGNIAQRLRDLGKTVLHTAIYDQQKCRWTEAAETALLGTELVLVSLFSPRTAEQFAALSRPRPDLSIVAISAAVSDALPSEWQECVTVSSAPTASSMAEAFEIRARKLCLA